MQEKSLHHLLASVVQIQKEQDAPAQEDVISVSETVSVAVSVYETIRNTLEYDEEHLLRRNAVRRIIKRRLGEGDAKQLSTKLIRELIWAHYLPNNKIPTSMIDLVSDVIEKYKLLFASLQEETRRDQDHHEWLLDVLSTEIEYVIGPPCVDEALASFAYQAMRERVKWQTKIVGEADQDLQLYIAIHRSVLHSNIATLRYRVFTLYYPKWRTAKKGDPVVQEIVMNLRKIINVVEEQIFHPAADPVHRFVRRHAVVFRLIADVAQDNPQAFASAIQQKNVSTIDAALTAAIQDRYGAFRSRLFRTVIRAAMFLLLTKSILAILLEYPYELFVLKSTDYFPLAVNILFPPFLLSMIGLTVRISQKENTAKMLDEAHAFLGVGEDVGFVFKQKRPWMRGPLWVIFNSLYFIAFFGVVWSIAAFLRSIHFNPLSIAFFIFFLSLVAYFGIRIRNTRRELLVMEDTLASVFILGDILFLPIIRAGRWVAMRAPKINIFLFFFDFIIEAPFKAMVELIENWLAFLREKREEI